GQQMPIQPRHCNSRGFREHGIDEYTIEKPWEGGRHVQTRLGHSGAASADGKEGLPELLDKVLLRHFRCLAGKEWIAADGGIVQRICGDRIATGKPRVVHHVEVRFDRIGPRRSQETVKRTGCCTLVVPTTRATKAVHPQYPLVPALGG